MKKRCLKKICIVVLVLFISPIFSQQKEFVGNPDTGFEQARKMAFNKQRKEAQALLKRIIAKYPNYLDLRSFLANTYSWDGDYKKAREGFGFTLKKDPKRKLDLCRAPISCSRTDKKGVVSFSFRYRNSISKSKIRRETK